MDGTSGVALSVDWVICGGPVTEELVTCADVELELINPVEDGRQKSLLKITGPQVLSVFDTTTI